MRIGAVARLPGSRGYFVWIRKTVYHKASVLRLGITRLPRRDIALAYPGFPCGFVKCVRIEKGCPPRVTALTFSGFIDGYRFFD
jgi:hypothetical protein